jgi:hypothetical protein
LFVGNKKSLSRRVFGGGLIVNAHITALDTDNLSNIPFTLLIPGGGERVRVPESHLEYKEAKLRAFLVENPIFGAVTADTGTKTETITHCDHETTVHDGNKTYTQTDTEQDGTDDETWTDD